MKAVRSGFKKTGKTTYINTAYKDNFQDMSGSDLFFWITLAVDVLSLFIPCMGYLGVVLSLVEAYFWVKGKISKRER